jgi:KUP system potassium uptake protein
MSETGPSSSAGPAPEPSGAERPNETKRDNSESSGSTATNEATPPSQTGPHTVGNGGHGERGNLLKVSLAALGIVYGDIGTSPLYAMRECFNGTHGVPLTHDNVLGVLSLIFWSLTLIVSVKYIAYVLRADNKGEGGVLALMALASSSVGNARVRMVLFALGIFGAALLYGDGAITPAMSVLSAVEGLEVAAPRMRPAVLPLTIVILIGLFTLQRRGTAGIGAMFGPIMLVWFTTLGVLGVVNLVRAPEVFNAMLPTHGARFLIENGSAAIGVLSGVFLVVTGSEALYADLGHFGRAPIRRAWFSVAFPGLFLNYLGQGALLLTHPDAVEHPFFRMVPEFALYPMIALSTTATVVACQALISGVYSLSRQGTMLGVLPRLTVKHTSAEERGQIYVPSVNWLMLIATIFLVLEFRSSSNLAAAYGIAVSLTMLITSLLTFFWVHLRWGWSLPVSLAVTSIFIIPELAFAGANLTKVADGGWFPLLVAALLFMLMTTWKRGREILARRFREQLLPLSDFFDLMQVELPKRVPGTAVFMTSSLEGTPQALLHNFVHNRVVHQHVVLLTIITAEAAHISPRNRYQREELSEGFIRIIARYGFMEQPDVPKLLTQAGLLGAGFEGTSFFLGRETMIATSSPGMARWRLHIFAFLARNAQPATKFFNIPPDRVMEIGTQIEL